MAMFLFQIQGKKSGERLLGQELIQGSHDLATSYYLASEPSTLKGYVLRFALDVESQYAKTCATALEVQSPQGTSFIFEKQGYFASAESVSVQFSHAGTLHSGEMIQIGGMELKVIAAQGLPKRWVLYNGRSQFELSDGGHLLEVNNDNSRIFSEDERKYWAPVVCGDGKERLGIEYPFTVSLRSEGGKENLELAADRQAGLYGLWAEGRGVGLPFGINLQFKGHREEEISKLKLQIIDNSTGFSPEDKRVIKYSIDKGSDLSLQVSGSGETPVSEIYLAGSKVVARDETGLKKLGSIFDSEGSIRIYREHGLIFRPYSSFSGLGGDWVYLGLNSDSTLAIKRDAMEGELSEFSSSISLSKLAGQASSQISRDLDRPAYSAGGVEYARKSESEIDIFFFDPSKSQFHWTASNSSQPYKDWEWNQLEYKGRGTGNQFTISPVMYPNPAKEYSSVEFNWPGSSAYVELSLYDMTGRLVKPIFTGPLKSGQFRQIFDVRDLLTGSYLVQGSIISFDPKWERHPIGGQGALFRVVR